MAVSLSFLLQQQPPGSVPGVSDTAAIIIGTLLTLAVLYAIVTANLRKTKGNR